MSLFVYRVRHTISMRLRSKQDNAITFYEITERRERGRRAKKLARNRQVAARPIAPKMLSHFQKGLSSEMLECEWRRRNFDENREIKCDFHRGDQLSTRESLCGKLSFLLRKKWTHQIF